MSSAVSSAIEPTAPSPVAAEPKDVKTSATRPAGATAVRRRAATPKPNSTRAAGAGGSSQTMLRLYTPEGEGGLKVDPYVVIVLSLAFIGSIFFLHISSKVIRSFTK